MSPQPRVPKQPAVNSISTGNNQSILNKNSSSYSVRIYTDTSQESDNTSDLLNSTESMKHIRKYEDDFLLQKIEYQPFVEDFSNVNLQREENYNFYQKPKTPTQA